MKRICFLAIICGLLIFHVTAFGEESDEIIGFVGQGHYMDGSYFHAYFEITNTSEHILYLSEPEFQINDESGNLMQVISDNLNIVPHIIAPGENAYIYTVHGVKLREATLKTNFVVAPNCLANEMNAMPHFFETNSRSLSWNDACTEIYAVGKFVNDTEENVTGYMVAVVTDDADDSCVAIGRTLKSALPGEEVAFDFTVDEYMNLSECSGTVGYNFFFDSMIYPE